jgi:hypothetical protein
MWAKILLILSLYGSASVDAWTTNQWVSGGPPGWAGSEANPLYRPFAGSKKMYVAVNLAQVPLDIWILSGKKRKAARWVAVAMSGFQSSMAIRNNRIRSARMEQYRQDRLTWPKWDGVYRDCPFGFGVNAAGCPYYPPW